MATRKDFTVLLTDLIRLSEYSSNLLKAENIHPETLYPRKAYVYSQFILSVSFVNGIIALAERGQTRAMAPLIRSLWEGWVGVVFVYSVKSHVWAYYLQMQEELTNQTKRDKLCAAGEIKDRERYEERNKETTKIVNTINRWYKELPLVPGVITIKNRSLSKRKISLKEKCQIIDYYQSLRATYKPDATTLAEWYEWTYGQLSGTAHASVTDLNALYKYDENGRLHIDVGGGSDMKQLCSFIMIAYLYHYLLMKVFMKNISTSKHLIPDDIKIARRRMTSARFRNL